MNQDTFTEKTFVFIQIWLKKGNSPTVQSHYHHSCCWASGLSPSESCSLQQPGPAVAADAWPHCHWGFNVLTILEPIYCLSQDLVQNVFTLDCNSLEAEEIEGFVVCWRLHLCDPHPTPWRQPSLQLPAPSSSSAWVLSDEIEQLLFVMLYDLMCSFHNEWDSSSI